VAFINNMPCNREWAPFLLRSNHKKDLTIMQAIEVNVNDVGRTRQKTLGSIHSRLPQWQPMPMAEHSVTCLKEPTLNILSSNNLYLKHGTLQSHQAARAGIHTFEPENCKEFVHQPSLAQMNSQAW